MLPRLRVKVIRALRPNEFERQVNDFIDAQITYAQLNTLPAPNLRLTYGAVRDNPPDAVGDTEYIAFIEYYAED